MARPRQTPNTAIRTARASRDLALYERNLILKALIAVSGWPAHLEPLVKPQLLFPMALCVHTPHGQLAWTLTDQDLDLFGDLPVHPRSHWDGLSHDAKLQRLSALGVLPKALPESSQSPLRHLLERFNRPTVARIEHEAEIALGAKLSGHYHLHVRNDGRGVELERAGRKPRPREGWFYAATLEKP